MTDIYIQKITLSNWRNYDFFEKDLSPKLNEIIGPNGTGKTNLLEAIFFDLKQTSFRFSSNLPLIKNGQISAAIKLTFSDSTELITKLKASGDKILKTVSDDGVIKTRINKPKIPVVIFEPNLSLIVTGEKQLRRDLIDDLASIYSPAHNQLLKKYKRALIQRNNILKRNQKMQNKNLVEDIFVWDLQLSSLGAKIIINRMKALSLINKFIEQKYNQISSKKKDTLKINYLSNVEVNDDETLLAANLLNQFNSRINKDAIIGHTTTGPHRDDIGFKLNNQSALMSASRGEARSIIIATKLIEIEEIVRTHNQKPIILLDDIYSELDSTRQTKLKKSLGDFQVVVTGV